MPLTPGSELATVLLIDDDEPVRRMCRMLLEENSFCVLEADNGLEALLMAMEREGAIDLVITDFVMPTIGGVELGRVFKEIWPDLNVLYMSGSPRDSVGLGLAAGCPFLPKPFAVHELVDAVESCIPKFARV